MPGRRAAQMLIFEVMVFSLSRNSSVDFVHSKLGFTESASHHSFFSSVFQLHGAFPGFTSHR
jgi:hypothetical protein